MFVFVFLKEQYKVLLYICSDTQVVVVFMNNHPMKMSVSLNAM